MLCLLGNHLRKAATATADPAIACGVRFAFYAWPAVLQLMLRSCKEAFAAAGIGSIVVYLLAAECCFAHVTCVTLIWAGAGCSCPS